LAVIELVDFKMVVACIYRAPHGAFKKFLCNLDLVIEKVNKKGRKMILCGDWNVDFLKGSTKQQLLQNLLASNNLTNTVTTPTRITRNSQSLIDVLIVDKHKLKNRTQYWIWITQIILHRY
jgi:exonuclease III